MDILFLSHCVPNPPSKGEKIRAFHSINALAKEHRVHLACFVRNDEEAAAAHQMSDRCASVYAQRLSPTALPAAAVKLALGGCLNQAFYSNRELHRYVDDLARRVPLQAALVFSVVMAPYIPRSVPYVLDMIDVDSEKWFQYAESRHPAFLYRLEGKRLRREEIRWAGSSARTIFTTRNEETLFQSFAGPSISTTYMENGVDFGYFDPSRSSEANDLAGRQYVVFTGTMDYWPNADAATWFATQVLPELRRSSPGMEFFVVGRNPSKSVRGLARLRGVHVTGTVPDTRVYLKGAQAVVTPLNIARGIQNKVLEALAMGKPVLASSAVCRTLGSDIPLGVIPCDSVADYLEQLTAQDWQSNRPELRQALFRRFDWLGNTRILLNAIDEAARLGSQVAEQGSCDNA